MEENIIAEGLRLFAERASANLSKQSDLLFQATFPGEQYPAHIGIEGFGLVMSYTTLCGAIPTTSLAPTLLQKNWGGVEETCFYFSAHVKDGKPWLFLETRQFVEPNATAEDIASMLLTWRQQCLQAKKSFQ